MQSKLTAKNTHTSKAGFTFVAALVIAAMIFLPFIIKDNGMFLYYGDYNVQEIPFYQHAHQMIREGKWGLDLYTDLGANFVGSYSFYMLGSPFFWAMLPFPNSWVPYLMGPMFIFKFAFAALFAYHYAALFVQNRYLASLSGILYAFCGFHIYNVFFNHFVDVAVFFPLLLIGLENAVARQKYGQFALAVAINAAVNYFFFVGEVTFLIIYFCCRLKSKDFPLTAGKFWHLAFESLLGVCGGAVLLLPGLLALVGNGRISTFLSGPDILFYPGVYRYGGLLNSLFFIPELPSRNNFFTAEYAKWSSMSLWLPLFGIGALAAFWRATGKNFVKRLLTACALFALIPVLNSAFYAFNSSYYARWFYMPLLVMAMASAKAFELQADHRFSFKLLAAGVGFFALFGLLPVKGDNGITLGIGLDNIRLWVWVGMSAVCLAIYILLCKFAIPRGVFEKCAIAACGLVCVITSIIYLSYGKTFSYGTDYILGTALHDRSEIAVQDTTTFHRSDVYGAMDNLAMFWGLPTTQCFHTVVPASVMDFYASLGIERNVRSAPTLDHYGLNTLLSVKYLYEDQTYGDEPKLQDLTDYTQIKSVNHFTVYQNENFLPIGFGYNSFMTRSQLQEIPLDERTHAMLHALVLEDKDVDKLSALLTPLQETGDLHLSPDTLADTANLRRQTCSDTVTETKDGLSCDIQASKDTVVFFSIPYDPGLRACVDGTEAQIYRANVGFCAVVVPEGYHNVTFAYRAPGLNIGLGCLAAFALIWPVYTLVCRKKYSSR